MVHVVPSTNQKCSPQFQRYNPNPSQRVQFRHRKPRTSALTNIPWKTEHIPRSAMAIRMGRNGRTVHPDWNVSANANKSRLFHYRTWPCRGTKSVVQKSIFLEVGLHLRFWWGGACMIIAGAFARVKIEARGKVWGDGSLLIATCMHGMYSRYLRCVATSPYLSGNMNLM
jgi:hypothetical protein